MAKIPPATSKTVSAIYAAYEASAEDPRREHLGASIIGRECSRELWYSFRWATIPQHSGRLLRLFERGQREEEVFVANLRAIGAQVYDRDPESGNQFRFHDCHGHMGGSMDATARWIPEAPKAWHVCEFKTHGAKSFAKLQAEGVTSAKPEHVAQMQCYMHWSGMDRALYLAVNKDTDELYSERLRNDPKAAQALIEKASRIIFSSEPLARISERPDWYQCRYCDHHAVCHLGAVPQASCRTCAHATPERDGQARWSCARFGCDVSYGTQKQGRDCPAHIFLPALVPSWEIIDASESEGWIQYRLPDGREVRNGPGGWASRELAANLAVVGDEFVETARLELDAEVVG